MLHYSVKGIVGEQARFARGSAAAGDPRIMRSDYYSGWAGVSKDGTIEDWSEDGLGDDIELLLLQKLCVRDDGFPEVLP